MPAVLADFRVAANLLKDRRASGQDLYDEIWDGDYVFMPLPGTEHQDIVHGVEVDIAICLRERGVRARIQPGANVTDRPDDWTKNFRCPDVVVYLADNPAEDRGSHWLGGPDVALEILSEGDLTLDKLPFYAAVGVRELFVLDRDPWVLTLYRLTDGVLKKAAAAEPGGPPVRSEALNLDWSLTPGDRPTIKIAPA